MFVCLGKYQSSISNSAIAGGSQPGGTVEDGCSSDIGLHRLPHVSQS